MNRRDSFRIIPLSLAGSVGLARRVLAQPGPLTDPRMMNPRRPEPEVHGPGLGFYPQYARKVRDRLDWIRKTQSENLLEASYAIARTVKGGGRCWSVWDTGHSTANDQFPGRNGEPEFMANGFDPNKAAKSDLLLANRYLGPYDVLTAKDIFVIGGPAPWGGDAQMKDFLTDDVRKSSLRPYAKIWIETNITSIDADVYMPGEPAPIGPFSGIFGIVEYWMILADACRILSREGWTGKVKGDDPPLDEKTAWTNLNEPLMDEYFDTVMGQIEMIGAEMGDIRRIANAAVDAVLGGGYVYYYSRYYVGLATEALGRRGGLVLNKTVSDDNPPKDFKGTSGDVMIMGLSKPDDEVDLKHLDEFKAMGMKLFSIGPATCNVDVPAGRTVPKETLVHVGRSCDTCGLYAFKGFNRRVCPTSGPVMNQIFWALQMEVAEEIIRRTGNTPGVFFSAAIKGGNEHNALAQKRCEARGY
jgi:uncharacterized phosphosugar-binding protein